MTEAMHSQLTAAELHERLTEAEAILKRIAESEISKREGGHAMALSELARGYRSQDAKHISCDISLNAREQQQ